MSAKTDKTDRLKKKMLDTLEASLGVVTSACKAVGIHRSTHYDWMNNDEDYAKAVHEIQDVALDFAESQLHSQIKGGSTSATIFYLKCKGKKRGYIERQEIDFRGGEIDMSDISTEEIQEYLSRQNEEQEEKD